MPRRVSEVSRQRRRGATKVSLPHLRHNRSFRNEAGATKLMRNVRLSRGLGGGREVVRRDGGGGRRKSVQGRGGRACPRSYESSYLSKNVSRWRGHNGSTISTLIFTRIERRSVGPGLWMYQCKERAGAIRLGRGVAGHGVDKTANGAWVGRWEGERELPIPRTQTKNKIASAHQGQSSGGRPAEHGRRQAQQNQRRVDSGTARRTKAATM